MRYPDGGGLSEQGRAKRQTVRLQAAEWFAQDMPVREIAGRLRVTTNAVYVWRRQCVSVGRRRSPRFSTWSLAIQPPGPGGAAAGEAAARVVRRPGWGCGRSNPTAQPAETPHSTHSATCAPSSDATADTHA